MTTNATDTKTAPSAFDRSEVTRVVSLIRNEVSQLVNDSLKKNPLYSPSVSEAVARRDAAIKALREFAAKLDAMKKG